MLGQMAVPDGGETMKKHKGIFNAVLVVALVAVGFLASQLYTRMTTPTVRLDTTTVTSQLIKCQDLVTAKLEYRGLVTYEEGDIDWINKKGFTMVYDATVAAGVDLSKADVSVAGRDVKIALPQAKMTSTSIDPDSLKFYDEKSSLLNWQNRTDTQEALKLAKKDAKKKIDESALIKTANEQAESTVETLFSPFTGDNGYNVEVSVAKDGSK